MSHYPETFRLKRKDQKTRDELAEFTLAPKDFIQPYFAYEGLQAAEPLPSIYGQQKHNLDSLLKTLDRGLKNEVNKALLFCIPKSKAEKNFNYEFDCKIIEGVKEAFGSDLTLFTDLCLCSNTHSGHCGFLDSHDHVDNASSVEELVRKSIFHAQAGSDYISPSDMMDDRIFAIREKLDSEGLNSTKIMSYSTKFSSHFYGPFRDAAESTPSKGDRKTYQIDCRNLTDALECSRRDQKQGADILMVKPAAAYLDILAKIKSDPEMGKLPLAAYQVSGEYQGLYVLGQQGILDFKGALYESLIAIKRAGTDLIISYAANDIKELFCN